MRLFIGIGLVLAIAVSAAPAGADHRPDIVTAGDVVVAVPSSADFVTKRGTRGAGEGQFDYNTGLAVDANGNVYVADFENRRIQEFDSNGTFLRSMGGAGGADR